MNVLKIIAVGTVGAVLSASLRTYRPEYGTMTAMATGLVIMAMMCDGLFSAVAAIREIIEKTGIDAEYFKITLKVIGISYVTQFAESVCRDSGENAIAEKLDAAGKVCIMALSVPIVSGFLDVIISLLSAI